MAYIEFTGPPACGKTSAARSLLGQDRTLAAGRRSLGSTASSRHVNRIGLPPEGLAVWLGILRALPRSLVLAAGFCRDTGQVGRAATLLALLLKSRALAASPRIWVVDQGLQQHIMSVAAGGRLSALRAMHWRRMFLEGPWRPAQLIELKEDPHELIRRVKASAKHRSQCGKELAEDYVSRYVGSFLSQQDVGHVMHGAETREFPNEGQ